MMKTKRPIAIVLGALMTLSCFSGCGGGSGTAGSGANELMIGGAGPLTGSTAIYGIAVKNGAELAINEINEAGGVNGITFKLNFQDDENDAQKSVNAYNKCVDDGCKVFLGPVTSIPCVSVVEEAASNNMFLITPSATAKDCISSDNAVRVCFNDPNQGNASAQYIADNNLAKKIAVIYDSSDVYSSGIYETFDATAKEKGLEIVSVQSFTSSIIPTFPWLCRRSAKAAPSWYTSPSIISRLRLSSSRRPKPAMISSISAATVLTDL